jgi:DNA polymerase-3 subunit gamma/tau
MKLHTEYRPKTLDEVFGNESTVKALMRHIQSYEQGKSLPQVYLFHGPKGCGKTTLARIMADAFQCNKTEIDMADNRGIGTARDMIERLPYRTLLSDTGNQAFILDEVHQTNKEFQNALLKSLEDTPPHVFFFCCTTEPTKLLPTFRDRAQTYRVSQLDDKDLESLADSVAEKAKLDIPQKTIKRAVDAADGTPRTLLVLLNDIVGMSKREMITHKFDTLDELPEIINLCRALLGKESWGKVRVIVRDLLKKEDPKSIQNAVCGYMRAVLLKDDNPPMQAQIALEVFSETSFFDMAKDRLVVCCRRALEDEEIPF